ncbi:heterokaryon incompatibility protein-domain-containing protein [Cadophora sp. MPI-SDFR-AT-0126]|nr:heterokaryon incompatibility protein-domain-containing protein [Leotiomycetes sp. MPI-SDFR-AT-0126]
MEHYFQTNKEFRAVRWRTAEGREWTSIRNIYHASYMLRAPLASSNPYPYKPLDRIRNEIRLPRKSKPSKVDGQVNCTLSHASLDEKPQYEALSYTWCDESGDAGLNKTIIVDGHVISVTKNLEAASLRQLFTGEDERTLWVDALCINQADVPERNEQVGKMEIVYHEAIRMVTWLGEVYNQSRSAFKLLRLFLKNGIKETVYNGVEPADPHEAAPESVVQDTYAVIRLFNRQYWQPSWVVQEVALAKRVVLRCGSDSLSWEDIDSILKALAQEAVLIDSKCILQHRSWASLMNVVTSIVIEEKYLSLLAKNKAPADHKILPSWVPIWANKNIAEKIRIDCYDYPHNTFNASGTGSTADAYLLPNHVLGVAAAGQAIPDFVDEEFNFVPVFDTLMAALLLHRPSRHHGASITPPEKIKEMEEITLADIKIALSIYKPWDKILFLILGDLAKPVIELEKRKAEVNIWNIAPQCRKRRFIVVDGKECEIGPQGAEVGDHIVAILGYRVPLILRERKEEEDGEYRNVGDAFLQGYMEGKAVKDIKDGIRGFESFELH